MKLRDKLIGGFFIGIFLIAFCFAIAWPVVYYILKPKTEAFDTLKAYPFETIQESEQMSEKDSKFNTVFFHVNDVIDYFEDKIEYYTTDGFYFQLECFIATKFIDKTLGLDMTTSQSDGQDTFQDLVMPYKDDTLGYVLNDNNISDGLEKSVDFGLHMKNDGRNFLYFLVPGKYIGNEVYQDYSQQMHNTVIKTMEAAGLDVYDMWNKLENSNSDISSFFFKSDHHWLPQTGMLANKLLSEYLNENYGYSIDSSIFELDNYEITVLENRFLGSQGRKVSTVYAPIDDFPILMPKYDTDFTVFISDCNKTLRGSIQETLFDYSALENNLYEGRTYSFYGYDDRSSYVSIHNNNIHNGKRILFIKRSFADCMYPFFAADVEYLDVIDLRAFKGSLKTYINETNPDTIIMIYGVGGFNDIEINNFADASFN